jgi:maltose/moltooligosaccharide transporter
LPILNLAGPLTGLLIQPIIGAIVIRLGCQNLAVAKIIFLLGHFYVVSLYFFSAVVRYGWQQVWVLDAGNNTAMEPYRAFIADTLKPAQQPTGFQAQSFFWFWANFGMFTIPFPLVLLVRKCQLGFCLVFSVQFVPSDLFGVLIRNPY